MDFSNSQKKMYLLKALTRWKVFAIVWLVYLSATRIILTDHFFSLVSHRSTVHVILEVVGVIEACYIWLSAIYVISVTYYIGVPVQQIIRCLTPYVLRYHLGYHTLEIFIMPLQKYLWNQIVINYSFWQIPVSLFLWKISLCILTTKSALSSKYGNYCEVRPQLEIDDFFFYDYCDVVYTINTYFTVGMTFKYTKKMLWTTWIADRQSIVWSC